MGGQTSTKESWKYPAGVHRGDTHLDSICIRKPVSGVGLRKAVFTSTVEPEITTLWLIPLFAIIINFGLDLMHYRHKDELAVRRLPVFAQSALLAAALLAILISFLGSEFVLTSFVYQGF